MHTSFKRLFFWTSCSLLALLLITTVASYFTPATQPKVDTDHVHQIRARAAKGLSCCKP